MDVRVVLLVFALIAVVFVNADFFYNPPTPRKEDLKSLNLKCIPGRTVIKIEEKTMVSVADSSDEDYRRTHMNLPATEDESCQMCVCSSEGKDEYCSKRPARNVNECIMLAQIREHNDQNMPFDVDSVLSNRIRRRDLIYHHDELERPATDKCFRGTSYYSNSPKANDTDVDVASNIESLLDYEDTDICFYCICATDGKGVGCISRDPWYCEYFRYLRTPGAMQKRYGKLFQQDRPAYFTHLSYRIRRTMDEGMFQMVQGYKPTGMRGGDSLCCDHPSGHRRSIHKQVRDKIQLMRRRIPKENLMDGGEQQCVPYVSQYTDCTDENRCAGCKECNCNEQGLWDCQQISQCLGMDSRELNENSVDRAWETIEEGIKNVNRENSLKHGTPRIPRPQKFDGIDDELVAALEKEKYEHSDAEAAQRGDFKEYIASQMDSINERVKRSVHTKNDTHKVQFHNIVDEIDEDTLKHSNDSGAILARRLVPRLPAVNARRSGQQHKVNSTHPLQIEYNTPLYDHHIADNKIDIHNVEKHNLNDDKLNKIIGNKTKEAKDKDLSKIIVNELKQGVEIVGDKNSPSISNITFVRENDTLTAMAFIAGNLLNQLWNMEKEDQGESVETDVVRKGKIQDLVELFKEPLTLRQETFLKDALEHLADTMSKGDHKNSIPLCQQVEKIKANFGMTNCTGNKAENATEREKAPEKTTEKTLRTGITNDASIAAVRKLNNVMSLIRKYEDVQKNIKNLKVSPVTQEDREKMTTSRSFGSPPDQLLTKDESQSLNLYGTILEKITKLIVPKKKNKSILKAIRSQSILGDGEDLKSKLKRIYDIDLENSTFTSKDKLVLDYLINFRNKKCQLSDNIYDAPTSIEGGILQNLSEFFKIKSFVDLLNLLEPEKTTTTTQPSPTRKILRTETTGTTEVPVTLTTILETTVRTTLSPVNVTTKDNLVQTKEKLKTHLKAIISDLLELQKATGMNSKDGNIKIAEALPCLYNLLNNNRMIEDKKKYRLNKLKSVFDAMKNELKFNPGTRRSDPITVPKPKSADVWERIIKNADKNIKTRRTNDEMPQSFEDLSTLMQTMDDFINSYKTKVLIKGVDPLKRLSLVKTIDGDVRLYIKILHKVKKYLETTPSLPSENGHAINEFIENANININLDGKIINNLYVQREESRILPKTHHYSTHQKPKKIGSENMASEDGTTTIKLPRDEIINQLIKNRVQFYLKVKELEGFDKEDDINTRLARKILKYLEVKNYGLARELFKVFVSQKQQNKTEVYTMPKPTNMLKTSPRPAILGFKEPLLQFEEEKGPAMGNDMMALTKALMKQLENIKSMKS